ncbi:MAG: hypothetical protein K5776_00560 [Lachnospiraceae bacterium]|nr:hypothetical protein [Lachnospiraceae bacterium]
MNQSYSSIGNALSSMISDEEALGLFFIMMFVVPVLMTIAGMIFSFLLKAVPIYMMAERAGYSYPFLAFIPFGQSYLMHILPVKEYSFLGMYKSLDRKKGYIAYILIIYVIPLLLGTLGMFLGMIPFLNYLFGLLAFAIEALMGVAQIAVRAIMYIDLFKTYGKDDGTIPTLLGILGLFIPLVHVVALYIYCRQEPSFGFGNFYSPIMETEE